MDNPNRHIPLEKYGGMTQAELETQPPSELGTFLFPIVVAINAGISIGIGFTTWYFLHEPLQGLGSALALLIGLLSFPVSAYLVGQITKRIIQKYDPNYVFYDPRDFITDTPENR